MNCWMMGQEYKNRILVVYIAVAGRQQTEFFSPRFCESFQLNPPGIECDVMICCNGGLGGIPEVGRKAYDDLAANWDFGRVLFFERGNDPSWDIGAYIQVANGLGKDYAMMACFGESCYFHRAGWLRRFAEAWDEHGPGMYAVAGSHNPIGHLITTSFAIAPIFLSRYQDPVTNHEERYRFEHGSKALWRRIAASKFPTMMVTWDGVWPPGQWRVPANILQRGDQSNMLCWFNHRDRYQDEMDEKTQRRVAAMSDQPFR